MLGPPEFSQHTPAGLNSNPEPLQVKSRCISEVLIVSATSFLFVLFAIPAPIYRPFDASFRTVNGAVIAQYIDLSWMMAIQFANATALRFGHDIAFTYGPLGMLAAPAYYPLGYLTKLFASAVFAAGIIFAWAVHRRQNNSNLWHWVASALLLAMCITQSADVLPLSPPLLLLAIYVSSEKNNHFSLKPILILATLCGVALLVKATLWPAVALIVVYITADMVLSKKKSPWVVPFSVFLGTSAGWIFARQRLSDFPAFVSSTIQIMAGYKEMALFDRQVLPYIPFWFCAAGSLIWTSWKILRFQRTLFRAIWGQLAVLALIFLFFKHGFIRCDHIHLSESGVCLGIMFLFFLPLIQWRKSFSLTLLLLSLFVLVGETGVITSLAQTPFQATNRLFSFLQFRHGHSGAQRAFVDDRQNVTEVAQLPHLDGTVDIYSYGQSVLLAQAYNYHPRPVFQSYFAYTLPLAKLNAAFLQSPLAPQHVLFTVETIDDRLPSEDDGYSWPQLLSRYQPAPSKIARFLVLDRIPHPQTIKRTEIFSQAGVIGKTIAVPQVNGKALWLEVDIPKTRIRTISNLLFRESIFHLDLTTTASQTTSYRLLPETAAGGFVVSPQVLTNEDFLSLYKTMDGHPSPGTPSLQSIRLLGGPTSPRDFNIRLYSLEYEDEIPISNSSERQ